MKNDKKRPNKKLKQETTKIITLKLINNEKTKRQYINSDNCLE